MPLLTDDQVARRLESLPDWQVEGGDTLARTYTLPDFRAALAFVAFVGELAEGQGHHPDLDIRYNRVRLALSTHDAGGLTEKDFALAAAVDHRG